jgi:RNA polymerase sigma factor (sigma-70 family)
LSAAVLPDPEAVLPADEALPAEEMALLIANHARFLAFLAPRVESAAVAEEILQAAFVKGLERGATLRDGDSAVAWFYRLLRNALIDHYRRLDVQRRGKQRYAAESELLTPELESALEDSVCACMNELIPSLKPEYSEVLRRAELEGQPVNELARELGITPNNAAVRLHRAREALRKRLVQTCGTCSEHGCLQCTCKAARS